MPQQIALALYHRDHYSTGKYRKIFGYEAFHWGLLILGEETYATDVSDAADIDPVTMRMTNPTMDWQFRFKKVNPRLSTKLLGQIIIGRVPDGVTVTDLRDFFRTVPLPVKNTNPQQSCVTWALNAIQALQGRGWAGQIEMDELKRVAMSYADERVKGEESREPEIKQLFG